MKKSLLLATILLPLCLFVTSCENNAEVKVTTYEPTNITPKSAECGGDVVLNGNIPLSELGVCWSTKRNPTPEDNKMFTRDYQYPFSCKITHLTPGTKYYVRAYVIRGHHEAYYGKEMSFTTPYEDVCNPYNIKYVKEQPGTYNWLLKGYAKTLVFLCKKCYPLAYFLSLFRFNCFDNSCTAAETFRKIISTGDQKVLCLPRSIFIATTSRKFKQSGALFIGVFLPSSNMHAWVIEDGIIADRYDIDWILYTPVSMMI